VWTGCIWLRIGIGYKMRNPLSSHLLSKKLKIKPYKTIILFAILCGFEAWYLTLKEEHILRVLEDGVLNP
jgi:hypothetical protein